MKYRLIVLGLSVWAGVSMGQSLRRGENLMFNGSFDHEDDPLAGWTYNYTHLYNRAKTQFDSQHYITNHERVEVLPMEAGRRSVMRLIGNPPAGTKVDGPPIAIDSKGRYRLTMMGKGTGPGETRIVLDGYQWRPGIRPHDNIPQLEELRRVFRSKPVYFGSTRDGEFSRPGRSWSQGVRELPDTDMSNLGRRAWGRVEFLVLHVLTGTATYNTGNIFWMDDVVLERIE